MLAADDFARRVTRLDLDGAAIGRGVPGVDRQVQDHQFKLAGIDLDGPKVIIKAQLDMHVAPHGAIQEFGHAADLAPEIDRFRLERLAAREGQQLPR